MAISLTDAEKANIQHAIDLMLKGSAEELPMDSTCSENVAKAAVSCGFKASTGAYLNAIRDNPVTTLLQFILFVGA